MMSKRSLNIENPREGNAEDIFKIYIFYCLILLDWGRLFVVVFVALWSDQVDQESWR